MFNEQQLELFMYDLAKRCKNREELQQLLDEIPKTDWEALWKEIDYEKALRTCFKCRELKYSKTFSYIVTNEGYLDPIYGRVCTECLPYYTLTLECSGCCGQTWPTDGTVQKEFFCTACKDIKILLSQHNSRAKKAGQPATLTVAQWRSTLNYFGSVCAYCGGVYECLEHLTSVELAGTTEENCLPSCAICNNKKHKKKPEVFLKQIPPAYKDKILQWQEQFSI